MCGKQDKSGFQVGKHIGADASEQEHGAGSGADKACSRCVVFGNKTCIFHVKQAAAADGVTGKYTQENAERGGGRKFAGAHERG